MKKLAALALVAVVTAACSGGANSPTAPSQSVPNVAGNYSGTMTVVYPETGARATCPASTTVTQNGSLINVAPLQVGGQCQGMSVPIGQTTIDATGAFPSESGSYREPSCGVYNYTASGGFFGREARWSGLYTSSTCYNMNITINLSR